jgi:uncharacterized protein (DUF433 family)
MTSTRQFTARIDTAVLDRLERRASRTGMNRSRLAERLIDEGIRMEDHPGIVFRDGVAGRRAALAGGPDVWQVIGALNDQGVRGDRAVKAVADLADLTIEQVRTAISYYADHSPEIDERIRLNQEMADESEERWRREQHISG